MPGKLDADLPLHEAGYRLGLRRRLAALLGRWLRRQSFGWSDLTAELDKCRAPARFWWRDDDAVALTPALTTLLDIRAELDLPLALAVIPAQLDDTLVARLAPEIAVRVLQHGWDHTNHAAAGTQLSEFPPGRGDAEIAAQLASGREILADRFGASFVPVLVPPFNAVAADAVEAVRASGLRGLSLATDFAGLGLPSRNVHADLIDWRETKAVPLGRAIGALVLALRLRRLGLVEATRPIGVMTHHLVHDDGIWLLMREMLTRLKAHPNVAFPSIESIFA